MIKQAGQQSCNVSLGNWFSCFSRHYFTPLCLSSITLLSPLIAPLPVSIFSWKLHAPLHCKKIENEKQLYPPALPSLLLKWTNHPAWSYLSQPIALCWSSSLLTPSRGFPGGSDGKESACNQETHVRSLGGKDPLDKCKATHSSILAWRISQTGEPGRLQSSGRLLFYRVEESDTAEQLTPPPRRAPLLRS